MTTILTNHKSRCMYLWWFKCGRYSKLILFPIWYPIITNQWIRQYQQLALIRRIGKWLRITYHPSLKYYRKTIMKTVNFRLDYSSQWPLNLLNYKCYINLVAMLSVKLIRCVLCYWKFYQLTNSYRAYLCKNTRSDYTLLKISIKQYFINVIMCSHYSKVAIINGACIVFNKVNTAGI